MRKKYYSAPENFSISPLLSLLPVKGKVSSLDSLSSSFFARYEKVLNLQETLDAEHDQEALKQLAAEQAMLKQVLDWLEIQPGDK